MSLSKFSEQAAAWEKRWTSEYDAGVKRHLEWTESTLNDRLRYWAERQPDKAYVLYKERVLSYKECNILACRLANALLAHGCKKGDRVLLSLPNIPEIIISFLACYKIGAICVGLDARSSQMEMERIIADSGARTMILIDKYADKGLRLLSDGRLERLLLVGERINIENVFDYYDFLYAGADEEPEVVVVPDDQQILYYTGGTTGKSKGCCHTNRTLAGHSLMYKNWFAPRINLEQSVTLLCLPITHSYGMHFSVNWPLYNGGTVVLIDTPTGAAIVNAFNRYEPNIWPAVPALINCVLHEDSVKESKISDLELIFCGGAPIARGHLAELQRLTKAKVLEGYGMSESLCTVSFNPINRPGKLGSVGIPLSDVDVLIVDMDDGQTLVPPGHKGEIIYRGPQVIKQYWRNAEENAAIRDGWLYSGDIGYLDEDGYLYITDRKKDMIIVGGVNVYPREIDELLSQHMKIKDVCTVGVPDERMGEVPKSFVALKPGETMTEQEVIAYCREYLSHIKVPRYVAFISEIPKTKVNKLDKCALRKLG